jgi:delta 1-pyrroline-5-carboxylate dehydrogenase
LNPKSSMGSVVSLKHLDRIEKMVQDHKADGNLLLGGQRMTGVSELDGFDFSKGAFMPPTVISDINTESPLWKEEIFGPVVMVQKFKVHHILHDIKQQLRTEPYCRMRTRVFVLQMTVNMAWVRPFGRKIYREHTRSPRRLKRGWYG